MTHPQLASRLMTVAATTALAALNITGCSSNSGSSPSPSPSPSAAPTALSAAFSTNCASCHGSAGTSTPPGGTTKGILKGTTIGSAAAFIAYVRAPTNTAMAAYSATTISDATLTSDYTFLTK